MAIVSRTARTKPYILKEDRGKPEAEQTIWTLRTLKARSKMEIMDAVVGVNPEGGDGDDAAQTQNFGTALYLACKFGVDGWTNLRGTDGAEIEPETRRQRGERVLTDRSLDHIGQFLPELGAEVLAFNRLSGADDLGNSGASPTSSPGAVESRATPS